MTDRNASAGDRPESRRYEIRFDGHLEGSAMTNTHPDLGDANSYEIRIQGHPDDRWSAWFDGLGVRHAGDGTTVISGPIADQAALHGLLQRVRDLGLPLISVTQVEDDQPDPTTVDAR